MQLLSLNFSIYTVGGVWRPIGWSSSCAKLLYNAFSFCVITSIYLMTLSQLMDLLLLVDNVDEFINNTLMFVTVLAVCWKSVIAVMRRNAIIDLVRTLLKEPCRPRDEEEAAIQTRFDKFIRRWSIKYTLLATSSCTGVTVRSVMRVVEGHLPYRAWVPYDSNTPAMFLVTSVQQIMSVIFVTIINIATETLVFGFFLQTCAQLEIFESRLRKLVISKTVRYPGYFSSSEKGEATSDISEYIRHHLTIYKYAKTVNRIFNQVLFVQFFGSILVLCTSVYYMSSHITESESATLIVYTVCMFVQIYVYCWSGNEVMLKSASVGNAIYHMDWTSLSIDEKRNLLMIMKRSTLPIKFTSSFLITLSLESYSNILKMSYTAFNVLKQS